MNKILSFSQIMALVENHFNENGRKFIVKSARNILYSPISNYRMLEVEGVLDGLNEVQVVVNLEVEDGEKARMQVTEVLESASNEVHIREREELTVEKPKAKVPETKSENVAKEPEPEHTSTQDVPPKDDEKEEVVIEGVWKGGSITTAQFNHLKALRIRKTHNMPDEELGKLGAQRAQQLINQYTEVLKKK